MSKPDAVATRVDEAARPQVAQHDIHGFARQAGHVRQVGLGHAKGNQQAVGIPHRAFGGQMQQGLRQRRCASL